MPSTADLMLRACEALMGLHPPPLSWGPIVKRPALRQGLIGVLRLSGVAAATGRRRGECRPFHGPIVPLPQAAAQAAACRKAKARSILCASANQSSTARAFWVPRTRS